MSELPTHLAPRFAKLAQLQGATTSEGRRELLRQVSEALATPATAGEADLARFDEALAAAAADYSKQVRAEIARLVAGSAGLTRIAASFAFDDIEVAGPILRRSSALNEATLLRVVHEKSQDHLMAVTKRATVSPLLSQALVARGDDQVVTALLQNHKAEICDDTYGRIAARAQDSAVLQGPLVRRQGVPPELLNELYLKAEVQLKREIMAKLDGISPEEMEKAFQRSRSRVSRSYAARPEDFDAAAKRIAVLERGGELKAPLLVALLREGKASRTTFKLAFAALTGMEFEMIERAVDGHDIDTVALLCRGAGIERAVFVTLAIALDADPERAIKGAEGFLALYDSVPVAAARRALRFWKVRAAA